MHIQAKARPFSYNYHTKRHQSISEIASNAIDLSSFTQVKAFNQNYTEVIYQNYQSDNKSMQVKELQDFQIQHNLPEFQSQSTKNSLKVRSKHRSSLNSRIEAALKMREKLFQNRQKVNARVLILKIFQFQKSKNCSPSFRISYQRSRMKTQT
ncbi:UNKNOWN [Stylonychia lemnae]|uniref:Uncharacterized protein n=1 Tax=Stylonychia lemnae TaxID=5949 RepID=A0A078A647_STYLE|nr:UNKNOWN [Stylonychia lemnae]|eukprot:CDW77030.1 UNKNOWN [Stylonychia lemnae]